MEEEDRTGFHIPDVMGEVSKYHNAAVRKLDSFFNGGAATADMYPPPQNDEPNVIVREGESESHLDDDEVQRAAEATQVRQRKVRDTQNARRNQAAAASTNNQNQQPQQQQQQQRNGVPHVIDHGYNDIGYFSHPFLGFMTSTGPLLILLPLLLASPFMFATSHFMFAGGSAPQQQQTMQPMQPMQPMQQPIQHSQQQAYQPLSFQQQQPPLGPTDTLHQHDYPNAANPNSRAAPAQTVYVDANGPTQVRLNVYFEDERRVLLINSMASLENLVDSLSKNFNAQYFILKYQFGGELFDIKGDGDLFAALHTKGAEVLNLFVWATRRNTINTASDAVVVAPGIVPLWVAVLITLLGLAGYFLTGIGTAGDKGSEAMNQWSQGEAIDWVALFKQYSNRKYMLIAESAIYLVFGFIAIYAYNVDARTVYFHSWTRIMPLILGCLYGAAVPWAWQHFQGAIKTHEKLERQQSKREVEMLEAAARRRNAAGKDKIARSPTKPVKEKVIVRDNNVLIIEKVHEVSVLFMGCAIFLPICFQSTGNIYIAVVASQLLFGAIRSAISSKPTNGADFHGLHGLNNLNVGLAVWVFTFINLSYYVPAVAMYVSAIAWFVCHISHVVKPRYDLIALMLMTSSLPTAICALIAASPLWYTLTSNHSAANAVAMQQDNNDSRIATTSAPATATKKPTIISENEVTAPREGAVPVAVI